MNNVSTTLLYRLAEKKFIEESLDAFINPELPPCNGIDHSKGEYIPGCECFSEYNLRVMEWHYTAMSREPILAFICLAFICAVVIGISWMMWVGM